MVRFREMSEHVALAEQMQEESGPVVLVNVFTVHPDESAALVEAWTRDARVMQRQPGFVSTQLHQGLAGSGVFLNHALWQSVAHFRKAFADPEFLAGLALYPPSAAASPHLFTKVGVAGICQA
ncbi:hypothetical protein NNJEOMEG_01948 [Fundidesulfovibrio magnetotacticus]|uniref:ABM domain-containing protein n=1 Tax=Fundidesulfovibrio magnetotacticus TaxID=2730080 RepID=A0A6V8LVI5_9BACT|nr:antibiotic biosynthesis monooxygenase family protein [Fundidesulfovibrio magnetotacticus]GFK94109.1 hypothetical protein NNJEOMEG_01948 [Fundidesulfovibrio magnetotacticus]